MAVMNRQALGVNLLPHSMHLVDISMCETMSEMRNVSTKKILRLIAAPFRLVLAGWQTGTKTLYFVPSSPSLSGLIKDAWILLVSGVWFRHRVYHCHSGGVGLFLKDIPGFTGRFLRWVVGSPLAVIRVSSSAPDDHTGFASKTAFVVPNCIQEESELLSIVRPEARSLNQPLRILFIGLHSESKGLLILLRALSELTQRGQNCILTTLGTFNEPKFEAVCRNFLESNDLTKSVNFAGPKFGQEKVNAFREADLLVFPTHFECETFGLVVAESMAAGMPAVASDWSGLKDLIVDGQTGLLTPIKDAAAVANAIEKFCVSSVLCAEMGQKARERFITLFSQTAFKNNFRTTLHQIVETEDTRWPSAH